MKCNPLLGEAMEILGKDKITTTDFVMPEDSALSLKRRLDQEKPGEYGSLYRMAPGTKQDVVNNLFNSRSQDGVKGIMPNQSKRNVNYRGSTVRMKPLQFLNLAIERGGTSDMHKALRKDFAGNIAKDLKAGKNIKLGPPKLWLDIQGDKIVVTGHEGRHRSDAIYEMFGGDVKLPVDVEFRNNDTEFRARNLTEDIFDKPLVTEGGKKLKSSLRDLFGTAGLLLLLGQGEEDGM